MEKILKINVTQKHISDSRAAIFYSVEETCWCPIALALYEGVMDRKYIVRNREELGRKIKYIAFTNEWLKRGGASNPFNVAETIRINSEALNKINSTNYLQPNKDIKLPKEVKDFIIKFDKGLEVEPFNFELKIN